MARTAQPDIELMADFETTVFDHQKDTQVWAVGIVELFHEEATVLHSIDEFFSYLFALKGNVKVYFHNLKFDGSFILYELMTHLKKKKFVHAFDEETKKFLRLKDMPWKSYTYLISSMGQWYQMTIKNGRQVIKIYDSLKLLPFSVEEIGKSFKTSHQKLDMTYKGYRYPGCEISDKDKEYIKNDVFVPKEALEIMKAQGHNKMTIGSCCSEEFKKSFLSKQEYEALLPNTYEMYIDSDKYNAPTVGDYVRRSYKGGWCYCSKRKINTIIRNGSTLDVNSLYPSMMHSISGNYYPVGSPIFFEKEIPDMLTHNNENFKNYYYFVRIRCSFKLKKGMLPCIQIKGNRYYKATEWLETSDLFVNDKYYETIKKRNGEIVDNRVVLTLTCVDYELITRHYDLFNLEILDGCYFISAIGIFDEYINKYMDIKMNSTGAVRTLAKLFLNNLYGRLAMSTESSFKVARIEDGILKYETVIENEKTPGYIPCGSAITSYARRFTITAAQENYESFCYADTDSIHCSAPVEELKGVVLDDKQLCCWKNESNWDTALFVRQKTYIEKECEKYTIKCAGMPENCKKVFEMSMKGEKPTLEDIQNDKYTVEQLEFLKTKRSMTDFKKGLRIHGKLVPKQMPGGTLLVPQYFEIR